MELQGQRPIPATIDQTWAALNDPAVLKACINGCESVDRTADDAFTAVVALKVGPVSARFKGHLKLTDVVPPTGYTIHFEGQGGIAGFGKGSAEVGLSLEGSSSTLLKYHARATVGGKMAQIGSRLIDATAAKITEDFFKAFEAHLQSVRDAGPEPRADTETPASPLAADADADVAAAGPGGAAAVPGAGPARRPGSAADGSADMKKLGWLIGGVVALGLVYVVLRQ